MSTGSKVPPVVVCLLLVVAAGCKPKPTPKPVPSATTAAPSEAPPMMSAMTKSPVASTTAVATGAPPEPQPEVDPFTLAKCGEAFPTVGQRWTDVMTKRVKLNGEIHTGTFPNIDEDETEKVAYEILEASGGRLTRARVSFASKGGLDSREIKLKDGEVVSARPSTEHDAFVLGGAEMVIAKGAPKGKRIPELDKAVAAQVAHFANDHAEADVRFTSKKKLPWGEALLFAVVAKGTRGQHVGCRARYDAFDARGELVVRAADGAIVEMSLSGPLRLSESTCKVDGVTEGPKVKLAEGRVELKLTRECFRSAAAVDAKAPTP